MKNHATADGTHAFSQVHRKKGIPEFAYRSLGRSHLNTSLIGFGCYRIDEDHSVHINSLDRALMAGCNLIDTSTNYTDGGSERCVGKVLDSAISRGSLKRENVIVVSKVGYVQGENLELAQEQEGLGAPYKEMVKYADGCWHCIHPDFIRAQLTRSLERTGLETIDVYLLHNPEYFFMDAIHRRSKKGIGELRQDFYRRIRDAFNCLEDCVSEGLISHYGVSSNTFGSAESSPDRTSLAEMWKIAEEISVTRGGDASHHHFSVIQLPLNLFEQGPAFEDNCQGMTTLAFAKEKNLGVLVNRPLNAFANNHLVRLADFPHYETKFPLNELLKMVSLLEEEFQTTFASQIHVDPESLQPEAYFRWGEELRNANISRMGIDQWTQVSQEMLLPQVHYLIQELDKHFSASENKRWENWRNGYIGSIEELVKAVYNECSVASQEHSDEISARIDSSFPDPWKAESLSRKALGVIAHTPGVTCALNGMRRPEYVEDAMGVMTLPPIKNSMEILTSLGLSS